MGEDQGRLGQEGAESSEDQLVRVRRELREAKELLSSALRERHVAVQEAEETQRKRRKHTRDGERRERDEGEDEEVVAPLEPEQAARMREIQVDICEKQVRRLEDLLEELEGHTVPRPRVSDAADDPVESMDRAGSPPRPELSERASAVGGGGNGVEAGRGKAVGQEWLREFESRFTTAEDRDSKRCAQEQVDQAIGAVGRDIDGLGRTVEINRAIVEQQRLQEQHELEAETLRQVRRQLGEVDDDARVARAQRRTFRNLLAAHGEPGSGPAPLATFGPTGNPLEEMQSTMRQSAAGRADGPTAARWDRMRGRGRAEESGVGGRRDANRCRSQSLPGRQPREPAGVRGARSKSPRGCW